MKSFVILLLAATMATGCRNRSPGETSSAKTDAKQSPFHGTCAALPNADYSDVFVELKTILANDSMNDLRKRVVDQGSGRKTYQAFRDHLATLLNHATRDEKKNIGKEALGWPNYFADVEWEDVPPEVFAANAINEAAKQALTGHLRDVMVRIYGEHHVQ